MRAIITLVIAAGLLTGACSKKEEPKATETTTEGAKAGEADKAGGGGDKIGVKECDDYLAKFESCLKDIPEAGRPAMEQAMKQNRDAWKDMAKDPTTKAGLNVACKAALDGLAQNPACK